MNKSDLIGKIRPFLHDLKGDVWTDDELGEMIEEAAREYSRDTGVYRGHFDFVLDADGVGKLPDCFIAFLGAWNDEGTHVEPISSGELARAYGSFSVMKGTAEFIYEDTESIGEYRLCPNPVDKQTIVSVYATDFGLMNYPDYGIPTGAVDYGTSSELTQYSFIGDAQYIRVEEFDKISDYMAIVYHVVYQAYTVDSEFRDLDKAQIYLKQYELRVGHLRQLGGISCIKRKFKFY